MHSDDRLWVLIARKLSGEATAAELAELQARLGENASDQYLFEMLNTYWAQHPEMQEDLNSDADDKFNRILEMGEESSETEDGDDEGKLPLVPFRSNTRRNWAWAGSIAAMLVVGVGFYLNSDKKQEKPATPVVQSQQSEVMAKRGTRSKIILPDGSQVLLNSDSKLSYLNSFNNVLREVSLEGEAFFDVVKDPKHPFVVHTSGIDIKVLGTAFNVKSYQQDPTIEATLLRGMIEVTTRADIKTPKVILQPHEKLIFKKLGSELTVNDKAAEKKSTTEKGADPRIAITSLGSKPDSAIRETSWIYNTLIFDKETFQEVSLKMERWYNVKFTFQDERLMNNRITGTFQNETIQEALEALKLVVKFDYIMDGNNVEVTNVKGRK